MSVRFTYMRYLAEYEDEADSVEDAVRRLAWGEEEGALTSATSKIFDGYRVIEGSELHEMVTEAWANLA